MALPEGSYNQTAYVVEDLEKSAAKWMKATGAGPWYVFEVETKDTIYRGQPTADKYRLALSFLGGTFLELIQPLDDEPSILNEVLHARGPGFHHVAPQLSGLSGATFDARVQQMQERGLSLAMSNEVVGLGRAAFFDAQDEIGGFVEVFELGHAYPMVPAIQEVHLAWDGSDPFRTVDSLFSSNT